MTLGLIGKKLGMTQVFDKNGVLIPVTLIKAGPCPILQKKSKDSDGYCALRIGFDEKPARNVIKPEAGLFKKVGVSPVRIIREFRIDDVSKYEAGQVLNMDIFDEGEKIDVTGITKGRGFSGTIKRWGTRRGPETHGSHYHRRVGSMGASSDPSRVFKGKKLPGHYGNIKRTIGNLKIVGFEKDKNIILIKGSVPGHINSYIMIRKKRKKAVKSARR
jgi:large subunit ribosomal protein L3